MHFWGKTVIVPFQFSGVFVAFEFSEVFTTVFKICFPSPIFELLSSVLFLIVSMSSFLLEHWFWSISMSLTSALPQPGVSLWFVNSNLLASQLPLLLLFEILFHVFFQDLQLFFLIALWEDEGSAWGVKVYHIIFWTYVLLEFKLTTKISSKFPCFKNCKILVFKIILCESVSRILIFLFDLKRYRF